MFKMMCFAAPPPATSAADMKKLGLLPTNASIRVKKLSWGNQQHIDIVSGGTPFDIILGSDILNLLRTHRKKKPVCP